MNEQTLLYIIAGLFGIIIGGAGGTAIIRKMIKLPYGDEATTATTAATAAAATVAAASVAFRAEFTNYMKPMEAQLSENTKKLSELDNTISGLMAACPEKHRAVDRRLDVLEHVNRLIGGNE